MAGNSLYGFDYGGRNVPLLLPDDVAAERGLSLYSPGMGAPAPGAPGPMLAQGVPGPILDPTAIDSSSRAGRDAAMKEANRVEIDTAQPLQAPGPLIRPLPTGTGPWDTGNIGQNAAVEKTAKAVAKGSEPVKERPGLKTTEIEVPDGYAGGARRGGSPARAMRIKGGDVRASFQRKPGMELPEDYLEEQKLGQIKSDRALINAGLSEVEGNQELRDATERRLLQQRSQLLQERADRAHQDDEINKRRAQVVTREREAEEIARQPGGAEGYWQEKGMAAKMLSSVAIGLSEYARILSGSGGENVALRMQENNINSWVQEQRAKYEQARERGQDAKNAYSEAIEQWGTAEAAERDLKLRGNAIADAMLENQARKSGDRQLLSGVQAELARRAEERNKERLQLQELVTAKVVENWQNVPDQIVTVGGAQKPKDIDRMVRLPNGEYAWARDSTTARGVQGKIVANGRIAQIASEMQKLSDSAGERGWTADSRARVEALNKELMFTYKDAAQAGALDKGLQEALQDMTGDPSALIRNPNTGAKLGEVARQAQSKVNEEVRYNLHADPDATSPVLPGRPTSARSDE